LAWTSRLRRCAMRSRHSTCRAPACLRTSDGRRATRPRARSASLCSWLPSCCSREPSSMARGCEYPPVRPCYGSRLLTRCGDAAVTSPRRSVVNHEARRRSHSARRASSGCFSMYACTNGHSGITRSPRRRASARANATSRLANPRARNGGGTNVCTNAIAPASRRYASIAVRTARVHPLDLGDFLVVNRDRRAAVALFTDEVVTGGGDVTAQARHALEIDHLVPADLDPRGRRRRVGRQGGGQLQGEELPPVCL